MGMAARCMGMCGIADEVPDCNIETASNVNVAQDDSAPLVETLVAADRVPADDFYNGIPTT